MKYVALLFCVFSFSVSHANKCVDYFFARSVADLKLPAEVKEIQLEGVKDAKGLKLPAEVSELKLDGLTESESRELKAMFELASSSREASPTVLSTMAPLKSKYIIASVFSLIERAQPGSTVKIFTSELTMDGVFSALLLKMVGPDSYKRNLNFEVYLANNTTTTHIASLLQASSNIKVYMNSAETSQAFSSQGHTLVLADAKIAGKQGETSTEVVFFDSPLSKYGLKNQDLIRLRVRLPGLEVLRTSSLRTDVQFLNKHYVDAQSQAQVRSALEQAVQEFQRVPFNRKTFSITENDMNTINQKSYDLGVQLYFETFKKRPKSDWDIFDLLLEVVGFYEKGDL